MSRIMSAELAAPSTAALMSLALSFSRDALAIVEQPGFYVPNLEEVEDWRPFVPWRIRQMWSTLGLDARLVAYIAANTERIGGE